MATIIRVNGETEELNVLKGKKYLTLEQIQDAVGGSIEEVPMFTKCYQGKKAMFCDESGLLKNKERNLTAERISGYFEETGNVLVGDVVLCSENEIL
jgi:hypothetical protein